MPAILMPTIHSIHGMWYSGAIYSFTNNNNNSNNNNNNNNNIILPKVLKKQNKIIIIITSMEWVWNNVKLMFG